MLRYWTAGESHGPALVALVDGFPAGLAVNTAALDAELQRRQGGYGRGGRQRIETDTVTFLSGLWKGVTLGSPLALEVINRDAKLERLEEVDRPRPGHVDLAGAVKHLGGVRAVLERASARETAARVAAGPTQGFTRPTNNAGGLEGGTTNGQPLVVRAAMKPIATLRKPLGSVNLTTKEPEEAAYERSDVCAVSACSVIVENVVAFTVAQALVDKFGGDSIEEMKARWSLYHELARSR